MLSRAERSEPHNSFHHRHRTWIFFQAPNTHSAALVETTANPETALRDGLWGHNARVASHLVGAHRAVQHVLSSSTS
jgi:hypothetical protein